MDAYDRACEASLDSSSFRQTTAGECGSALTKGGKGETGSEKESTLL